jgi:TatD family-associated radical SAM protein
MNKNQKASIVYWIGEKLYLNITNKCSNSCRFCIKNFRRGLSGFKLELSKEPTNTQVIEALKEVINRKNWSEIVFCGFGEPTERLDLLLEVTTWIKRHYGKPFLFRVNTNGQGYLLNPGRKVVKELKKAGINMVSVSLNASEEKTYMDICRPKLDNAYFSVIDFIKIAKKELEVEVTAVTTEEVNLKKIVETADKLGVKFRKREYVPCIF